MQHGASQAADKTVTGPPSQRAEAVWADATAAFILDFLRASASPDFAELGHTLRERDAELCHHEPQPAQVSMSHVIRAIGVSKVSVADGAHILAAYLAEERGAFSARRMLAALEGIGADVTGASSFGDAVQTVGAVHSPKRPFMWVAAALRVWLDVPQRLDEIVHEQPTVKSRLLALLPERCAHWVARVLLDAR